MATISASSIIFPLRTNLASSSSLLPSSTFPHPLSPPPSAPIANQPFLSTPTSLRDSRSEDKKAFLERYGLNPNYLLTEPSTKTRSRGKEVKKTGRGKQVPEEEEKTERTTHRLLQVLGGKAKRKKLLSPKGMDVRPMMEVAKGSVFDILQAAGRCPSSLRPGCWLDLYSGTGCVGIEAISRGCSEVHFVEMDPWVVSNVLQPNLKWTGFLDVSLIHSIRVEKLLEQAEQFITDRRFGRTLLAIYGPKWAQKKRELEKLIPTVAYAVLYKSTSGRE